MSGVRAGRVVKVKSGRRAKSGPVVRMMAIMQDGSNNEELPKEFVEGGRTGRRNAMPDILHPPDVHASTADLPSRLQQLATSDFYVSENTSESLKVQDSDNILLKFLGSECTECCNTCNAMPQNLGLRQRMNVATNVSESSSKYCCSDERLRGFLKSDCSKRRSAVSNIALPTATSDPNNPQAGPSTQPAEDKTNEPQKKDSVS